MTPDQKAALQKHIDAIAEILYTDSEPETLESLEAIETTVREQMLKHVSPRVGFFLSKARQVQPPEESED